MAAVHPDARLVPDCIAYVQCFIKTVNYTHLMPTRYQLDVDLKATITSDVVDNSTKKIAASKVSPSYSFVVYKSST